MFIALFISLKRKGTLSLSAGRTGFRLIATRMGHLFTWIEFSFSIFNKLVFLNLVDRKRCGIFNKEGWALP